MRQLLTRRMTILLAMVAMVSTLLSSCMKGKPEGPKSIYQTISSDPQFSYLAVAVTKAGLAGALSDPKRSLTLFAPDNNAFIAAGFKSAEDLKAIPDAKLKAILLYHVLGSKVEADQIPQASNTPVATLNSQNIFATRTAAGKVFINGVSVTKANIGCTNGVIHRINRVLLPAVGTIVETAIANTNFSYLVAAVLRASEGSTNVAAVLSGAGPFTVFAPVNQAFINAGFATTDAIKAADPDALAKILTYHVIAGRIFSSDLTNNAEPSTVNGESVKILLGSGAQVQGKSNTSPSNIVATDIVTTNGVIHVIDQVLLP